MRIPRPSRADPDEERELARWHRERAERDALDQIDPTLWEPEQPAKAPAAGQDDDLLKPALHPGPRTALYVGTFAAWVGAMTLLHEPWWTFRHGVLVSIVTPILLGRLIEHLVLRRRPDWNRHEDPETAHDRGRPVLGHRARPYWAIESAPPGERAPDPAPSDETPASGDAAPAPDQPTAGPAGDAARGPDEPPVRPAP